MDFVFLKVWYLIIYKINQDDIILYKNLEIRKNQISINNFEI